VCVCVCVCVCAGARARAPALFGNCLFSSYTGAFGEVHHLEIEVEIFAR
jgi:hypothetical protein